MRVSILPHLEEQGMVLDELRVFDAGRSTPPHIFVEILDCGKFL